MAEYVENISIWQTDLMRGREGRTWSSPGPNQLALPTDYLQHSIFTSWNQSTDGITWTRGAQGIVVSPPGGYLTPRDALLLGTLGQRWLEDGGNEDDRVVRLPLNECARAMGYTTSGGKQRREAAASLRRLTTAMLSLERSGVNSRGKPVTARCDWHVLDANYTRIADDGGTSVRLSLETAAILGAGLFTYLTAPIARDLVNVDKVAARLWLLLESEALTHGFTYRLLRDPSSSGQKHIAEVVGISHWRSKSQIKARITKAIKVIDALDDGRYGLHLRTNKSGVTFLEVMRTSRRALRNSQ